MIKYFCDICGIVVQKEQLTKVLNVNKDSENDKMLCVNCFHKFGRFLKDLGLKIETTIDISSIPIKRGLNDG